MNAGVGEFVDQEQVVIADQSRDDADIGEIAGAEHAGRLGAFEPRQPGFELVIKRMIAGHQSRGAGADAIALRRLDRRLDDRGMPAKIEIIVARKRQQPAAAALGKDAVARRHHRYAAQPRALQRRKLAAGEFVERAHRGGMKAPNVG